MGIEINGEIAHHFGNRSRVGGGGNLAEACGFPHRQAPSFIEGWVNGKSAAGIKPCEFRGGRVFEETDAIRASTIGTKGGDERPQGIVEATGQNQEGKRGPELGREAGPNLDQTDHVFTWL